MKNIKIGDTVYTGVDTIKVKNADVEGEYITFILAPTKNIFSYEISSLATQAGTNIDVSITDDTGTTTNSYSSATDVITREFTGNCSMAVDCVSNDSSHDFIVRQNGLVVSDTANITIANNDAIDISFAGTCLTGDTLIMLADGTEKRIDSLDENDLILGYDPDTLELVPQKIISCDAKSKKYGPSFTKYTFSDGKEVNVVYRHAFYNSDTGIMACLDTWSLGMHARTIDGSMPELVKSETFEGKVQHFTLYTEHENYFANGLLSGNRFTKRLFLDLYKKETK